MLLQHTQSKCYNSSALYKNGSVRTRTQLTSLLTTFFFLSYFSQHKTAPRYLSIYDRYHVSVKEVRSLFKLQPRSWRTQTHKETHASTRTSTHLSDHTCVPTSGVGLHNGCKRSHFKRLYDSCFFTDYDINYQRSEKRHKNKTKRFR